MSTTQEQPRTYDGPPKAPATYRQLYRLNASGYLQLRTTPAEPLKARDVFDLLGQILKTKPSKGMKKHATQAVLCDRCLGHGENNNDTCPHCAGTGRQTTPNDAASR